MDLGDDKVEWFLYPLALLLDEEVARGNYDRPLVAPLLQGCSICVSCPRVTVGSAEGFSIPMKPFIFPTFFEALPF